MKPFAVVAFVAVSIVAVACSGGDAPGPSPTPTPTPVDLRATIKAFSQAVWEIEQERLIDTQGVAPGMAQYLGNTYLNGATLLERGAPRVRPGILKLQGELATIEANEETQAIKDALNQAYTLERESIRRERATSGIGGYYPEITWINYPRHAGYLKGGSDVPGILAEFAKKQYSWIDAQRLRAEAYALWQPLLVKYGIQLDGWVAPATLSGLAGAPPPGSGPVVPNFTASQSREDAIAAQDRRPRDAYQRYLLDRGLRGLAGPTQDYLEKQFSDRYSQYWLDQLRPPQQPGGATPGVRGGNNTPSQTFYDYLVGQGDGQPNAQVLRGQLGDLANLLRAGENAPMTAAQMAALDFFSSTDKSGQLSNLMDAALQPRLQEVAAPFRRHLIAGAQRGAEDLYAKNPGTSIPTFMDYLRQRVFF